MKLLPAPLAIFLPFILVLGLGQLQDCARMSQAALSELCDALRKEGP